MDCFSDSAGFMHNSISYFRDKNCAYVSVFFDIYAVLLLNIARNSFISEVFTLDSYDPIISINLMF
jgi:hypothetical protein